MRLYFRQPGLPKSLEKLWLQLHPGCFYNWRLWNYSFYFVSWERIMRRDIGLETPWLMGLKSVSRSEPPPRRQITNCSLSGSCWGRLQGADESSACMVWNECMVALRPSSSSSGCSRPPIRKPPDIRSNRGSQWWFFVPTKWVRFHIKKIALLLELVGSDNHHSNICV